MSLLNWRDHSHWDNAEADCVLCANPTHLRSERAALAAAVLEWAPGNLGVAA